MYHFAVVCFFFFFNDTATTEIYTLSLHDALPISGWGPHSGRTPDGRRQEEPWPTPRPIRSGGAPCARSPGGDRKSTRLNSSHANISYAVFCLKKKKNTKKSHIQHVQRKQHQVYTQ